MQLSSHSPLPEPGLDTRPIVAAEAPIRERKAPRILSALSFVISENMLTMPNSRINSIARDIAFFFIEFYSLNPETSSIEVGMIS